MPTRRAIERLGISTASVDETLKTSSLATLSKASETISTMPAMILSV